MTDDPYPLGAILVGIPLGAMLEDCNCGFDDCKKADVNQTATAGRLTDTMLWLRDALLNTHVVRCAWRAVPDADTSVGKQFPSWRAALTTGWGYFRAALI
ncbi:hypothetical protein [Pararhodobacter zhoushanensis]|uniref:Uncharacterized protein n=1 Tax=Pararhodobacter zhoushanensis TaxID=2479545 RepID=A0ABT3GWW2_9RHOB|nr:hypothetical protein [Pararhodobacter zhoushanensis]MCW1932019.1 hypothetical protein [Pararhodobacter zhoushanensis]